MVPGVPLYWNAVGRHRQCHQFSKQNRSRKVKKFLLRAQRLGFDVQVLSVLLLSYIRACGLCDSNVELLAACF